MTTEPTIVYIASSWRSGSTLLDRVLGTSPHAFGAGELKSLERFARDTTGRLDDAGFRPDASPMWGPIVKNIDTLVPSETEQKFTFTWLERLRLLLIGSVRAVPYRYKNEALYRAIQQQASAVTGKSITHIIDSSKPLYRIVELYERTDLPLYVIHLVRDIRGVVYSHTSTHTKVSTSRAIATWLATNIGIARYLRVQVPKNRYIRIRYEAFVAEPERHLRAINALTGLAVDYPTIVRAMNEDVSYRFSGNETRQGSFAGFYQNTKWRDGLPKWQQVVLAPLNWLFPPSV